MNRHGKNLAFFKSGRQAHGHSGRAKLKARRSETLLKDILLNVKTFGHTALYDSMEYTIRNLLEPVEGKKAIIIWSDRATLVTHARQDGAHWRARLD